MLGFLRRGRRQAAGPIYSAAGEPARQLKIPGIEPIDVAAIFGISDQLIFADWTRIDELLAPLPEGKAQSDAWAACQLSWLQHLGTALGPTYQVLSSGDAFLLSNLQPRPAKAALEFLGSTRRHIVGGILKDIAQPPRRGKDILIVVEEHEAYYDYVAHYYPSEGDFAASSGMYIDAGCGHFVTVASSMHSMEAVIAHELTHACVAHLPIPAWLNEGLAVNTESRIAHTYAEYGRPQQVHRDLQRYWAEDNIQNFWCGSSYIRPEEGSALSYHLGRIMVEQMSLDWPSFRAFTLQANRADAGQAAAEEHLQARLGAYVCALLQKEYTMDWEPNPARWMQAPEAGAFS